MPCPLCSSGRIRLPRLKRLIARGLKVGDTVELLSRVRQGFSNYTFERRTVRVTGFGESAVVVRGKGAAESLVDPDRIVFVPRSRA